MTQFATKDEFDELKAEMQVLKNLLAKDEIINQKMLEATFHSRVLNNTISRRANLLGVATGLFIAGVTVAAFFMKGTYSLWFMLVTVAWGLLCAALSYRRYHLNTREKLLSTPLTESVREILNWKKEIQTTGLALSAGLIIWLPCLLIEIWGDITTNLDHAVIVFVIVVFALTSQIGHYRKVRHVIDDLLAQIGELTK